jgi:hypothetical protein
MKVLKVVDLKDSYSETVTCVHCHTEYEFDLGDVKHRITCKINGRNWDEYYVTCPTCNANHEVVDDFSDDHYGDESALSNQQRAYVEEHSCKNKHYPSKFDDPHDWADGDEPLVFHKS